MKRALALLLVAAAARASEPERFGFGVRSPAMAGTGAATADDYEATYANPAGLAFAPSRRLTVGYVFGLYHVALDGAPRDIDTTNGLIIGADLPLPLGGALRDRLAIGLGFYLPTGVINRARAPFPPVAGAPAEAWLPLLDSPTQTVSLMVSGAVRLTDRLSLGGGVLALAALVGVIHLETDGAGRITSRNEEQLVTDFAPVVGARYHFDRVRLGVVFRGRSQSRYDIRIDNKLTGVVPFDLPVFTIAGISQYDPLQAAAEAAVSIGRLTLVGNLTYKHWSAFPNPSEVATPGTPPPPSPDFHDTVVPRVAAEWRTSAGPVELALRGGYFFEWSPAPEADKSRFLVDGDRHVFTVGEELKIRNQLAPLHLELFFQWHLIQANQRVGGRFGVAGVSLGAEL